jgi:tetratricopeptide (TPR) repeat protein
MPDNTPNKGLEVVLETQDRIASRSTTADDDGRFQFRQLNVTTYYLYMDLDGFEPIEQQVTLQQSGPTAAAVVVLQLTRGLSDPTRRTAGPDERVKSAPSAPTFAAGRLTKYPQKAVKEYPQRLDEETRGNLDKAAGHFEKATGDASQFYEAWLELGRTRQRQGRFDPAIQAFQRARTLQPQAAQPLVELGGLDLDRARKLESEGNGVEAISVYRSSLKLLDEASKLDPSSHQLRTLRVRLNSKSAICLARKYR